MTRLVLALVALSTLLVAPALGQDGPDVVLVPSASWGPFCGGQKAPGPNQAFLGLTMISRSTLTEAQAAALRRHLEAADTYSFTSDWPAVAGVQPLATTNSPFVLTRATVTPRLDLICLLGQTAERMRGEVHVRPIPAETGVRLAVRRRPDPGADDRKFEESDLTILYTTGEPVPLPKLRRSVDIGSGSGGATLEITYSGLIGGRPDREDADPRLLELSLAGRIPIGTPRDVRDTPGAESDASERVADTLSAELAWISYGRRLGLQRAGARVRTTASGKGAELTGFYSPFVRWFDGSRALVGVEGELGWREGDAEFKNLTTRAPDRGNLVARIGAVAEWAPEFLGVNKNLTEGLRFFIRGRGWLDTYDNDDGKRSVRFARFLDTELFYNFSKDSRAFLRAEYGELPPDLSNRTRRIFVGVGQAF